MNISIHDDLAKRIKVIAKLNGISIKSYVNNLVEQAILSEERLARSQKLGAARAIAAQREWEEFKFPTTINIEACDGWDISEDHYTRKFYYLPTKVTYHDGVPEQNTRVGTYTVIFMKNSAVPSDSRYITE